MSRREPGDGPEGREEMGAQRGANPEVEPEGEPALPPRRRRSHPRARSPVFAVVVLALIAWLMWDLWPDVSYFLSSTEPIDLGVPGAYHLERALPNRLVRIAGAPVASVSGVGSRGGERRVIALSGTNLAVDRPGGAGPAALYEGRLLPARSGQDYAPFVAELRRRGWAAGGRWMVLRDGERPRQRWSRPLLSLVLLTVAAVNVRALVRSLIS